MDTFPIVRRKNEQQHGEYRAKRVILEHNDRMAAGEAVPLTAGTAGSRGKKKGTSGPSAPATEEGSCVTELGTHQGHRFVPQRWKLTE